MFHYSITLFFLNFGYSVGPRRILYYNTKRLFVSEEVSDDLILSVYLTRTKMQDFDLI